jgi:hypothetical protein
LRETFGDTPSLRDLQTLKPHKHSDQAYDLQAPDPRSASGLFLDEGSWDAAKHPRRGSPPNAGWFASTGGGSGAASTGGPGAPSNHSPASPRSPFQLVGHKAPKQKPPRLNPVLAQPAGGGKPPQDWNSPPRSGGGNAPSKAGILPYFKMFYGDKGQKLLEAFEKSGGLIKIENPWLGAHSSFSTRDAWGPHQIRLRTDLNPAEAAKELMERLIEASGSTEVRWHLDHYGSKENIETLIASYKQSVKQAASAVALASELYLSGISIASEGADWVLTLHDLSQGNYYAAIGFIPFLPASVGKTGVVLKHGKQTFKVSAEMVRKIKALPIDDLIALLESTRKLARNMEKAGIVREANTAAHHIVPAALKKFPGGEKAREILTKFGIGVENAANGVYLPSKFDDAVKAAYHGSLHSKKYLEEVEKRLRKARSKEEALIALDQIRKDLLAGTFPH